MADRRYFIDVFAEVAANVQSAYDSVNDPVEVPYYLYGRPAEIIQLLQEKDESNIYKYKKYPLIVLFTGLTEQRGRTGNFQYTVTPRVSILTDSSIDFRTGTRYDNSIKPTLYPIYELLLQEIANNPNFYDNKPVNIDHDITIWDGNPTSQTDGLSYPDYVDAIDIVFNDLRVFTKRNTCA